MLDSLLLGGWPFSASWSSSLKKADSQDSIRLVSQDLSTRNFWRRGSLRAETSWFGNSNLSSFSIKSLTFSTSSRVTEDYDEPISHSLSKAAEQYILVHIPHSLLRCVLPVQWIFYSFLLHF